MEVTPALRISVDRDGHAADGQEELIYQRARRWLVLRGDQDSVQIGHGRNGLQALERARVRCGKWLRRRCERRHGDNARALVFRIGPRIKGVLSDCGCGAGRRLVKRAQGH